MSNMNCQCFDFPVSWTFFRSHCIEQHNYDPGSNGCNVARHVILEESKPVPVNAFQELSARFNHLQNNINAHIDASKRKRDSL